MESTYTHPSAIVEQGVTLGKNVKIWHFAHVRTNTIIGDDVSLGNSVYVDSNVVIGRGTRVQNKVNIFNGVKISNWVFIGPSVVFTNDLFPRVGVKSWDIIETHIEDGAAIGAGAKVICGITLGSFCMIGAGSVVTKSVKPFHLSAGVPAKPMKKVCACGLTMLSIDTAYENCLRDCCKERLEEEVYKLAKRKINELSLRIEGA